MPDEHTEPPRFEPGDYYTAQYGTDQPPTPPPTAGMPQPTARMPQPTAELPPQFQDGMPPQFPGGMPPGGMPPQAGYPGWSGGVVPYQPVPGAPPGFPGYWGPPPVLARPTNNMAIVALIMLFVFPPLAIVFGAVARKQIERTGEDGSGMATAGLVGGIVLTALWVLAVVALIVFYVSLFQAFSHLATNTGTPI